MNNIKSCFTINDFENNLETLTGISKSALTKITPITLIPKTTLKASATYKHKDNSLTFTPETYAISSFKEIKTKERKFQK